MEYLLVHPVGLSRNERVDSLALWASIVVLQDLLLPNFDEKFGTLDEVLIL